MMVIILLIKHITDRTLSESDKADVGLHDETQLKPDSETSPKRDPDKDDKPQNAPMQSSARPHAKPAVSKQRIINKQEPINIQLTDNTH